MPTDTNTLVNDCKIGRKWQWCLLLLDSAQDLISLVETGGPGSAIVRQFLTMLAICHTVIPDRDDGKPNGGIIYHAASPGMFNVPYLSTLVHCMCNREYW